MLPSSGNVYQPVSGFHFSNINLRHIVVRTVPIDDAVQKASISSVLWNNINLSVTSLTVTTVSLVVKEEDDDANDNERDHHNHHNHHHHHVGSNDEVRPAKRPKHGTVAAPSSNKKTKSVRHDPFHIWLHEEEDDDSDLDDIPTAFGGKLAQLTVAGLMNAISGIDGGIVEHYKKIVPRHFGADSQNAASAIGATQLTFGQLHQVAMGLFHSIETRVQQDVLVTTPIRIQQMLAPDLQPHEFKAIRKRIYDTVILGKGMSHYTPAADDEELPVVASSSTVHDIEKVRRILCVCV